MSEIVVRKVESKADYQVFFEFPWKLYKDSPYWVPPLKSTRNHTLDQDKDASWEYMTGDYFVAWQGETPVGTIAAFTNNHHNQTWNENIGWFGMFEFIDDPAVAKALLETAENWARQRGHDALRGPASFTLNAEVGVLITPYDKPPLVLMPYNYDYYPTHIEAAGYHKEKDLGTWCTDRLDVVNRKETYARMQRIGRLADKARERGKITFRYGDRKNLKEDFRLMKILYNDGWTDNWGFTPLTDREFQGLIDELSQIYDPSTAMYFFVDGEPAGFIVGVPDMNQVFLKAYPKPNEPEIFALLRTLWHWKIRPKVDTLRFALAGLSKKHQGSGLALVIAYEWFKTFSQDERWNHYDGGWILEDNDDMNTLIRKFTVDEGRLYRIYQKAL